MIQLDAISKRFGSRLVLSDLSLRVPAGEIYGLLGHNGAGKSTAIGIMLGQVWANSGVARICGHDVSTKRCQALLKVGAIFESPAFYDYLSGWRNLLILSSYSSDTPKDRVRQVIDWVGLSGREHSKVRTYSHGMRARLALAQALLPHPEVLILDEPSDGLDPEGIHEMRQTILLLHRELQLTILLSSHLLNEVEQLCTRIAVLNRGKLVFEGTLESTREQGRWFRLACGDFPAAVRLLQNARIINDFRNPDFVGLAPDASSDAIVRHLVEQKIPVFEITRHEQTLEDFYLRLMNAVQPPSL